MSKKPNGYWKDVDNLLVETKKAMEDHGWDSLPSGDVLAEHTYSALGSAISKYHGGFHRFRELLGQHQLRVEIGTWRGVDYTIEQARRVMSRHRFDVLPSHQKLWGLGYSSLAAAIQKYHGGFHKFRELLGEREKKKVIPFVV